MKKYALVLIALTTVVLALSACHRLGDSAGHGETPSLIEIVARGNSRFFAVDFDRYEAGTETLPIGVFDSGIGGLTVLEAILRLDAFDNATGQPGADGKPDFEDERFVYLGDQANMPYGNYAPEEKTEFLRELILKDVIFLCGTRYWSSGAAEAPRRDKPPVKAIVIACNTATAYGLERIRQAMERWQLPVPVVGIIEVGAAGAVDVMAQRGGKGAVAVLATVGTCKSQGYINAIAQQADSTGIERPAVVQQGCLGLAGVIEGDPSYIAHSEEPRTAAYRGPAVGHATAPIDPDLSARYGFEAQGLLGDIDDPATWRLNSVENYIHYHTTTLLEAYRRSGRSEPIGAVILGCTHFPLVGDEITESFARLRDFQAAAGAKPYEDLIGDRPSIIDPAELTAQRLYQTLAESGLLAGRGRKSVLDVDEFYISVPNVTLPDGEFTETGSFTYDYKYGRDGGRFEAEYVKRVPMSGANLSPAACEKIKAGMPLVWDRLVAFSRKSPCTPDPVESVRLGELDLQSVSR